MNIINPVLSLSLDAAVIQSRLQLAMVLTSGMMLWKILKVVQKSLLCIFPKSVRNQAIL
jgi:hypothetical protein